MKKTLLLCFSAAFLLVLCNPINGQDVCTASCLPGDSTSKNGNAFRCVNTDAQNVCGNCICSCSCPAEQWQGYITINNKIYAASAALHLSHPAPYAFVTVADLNIVNRKYRITKRQNGNLLFAAEGRNKSYAAIKASSALRNKAPVVN